MLQIHMLPARHGDALLIEYGDGDDIHRILIDGGPWYGYTDDGGVREQLARIDRLDLLVITHVDTDHIDGIIRLFQDPDLAHLEFGDIWFNGWRHLQRAVAGKLDGKQGEYLGALLEQRDLPWNTNPAWAATDGVVAVPDDGVLPVAQLPGGATATLVSPGRHELTELSKEWRKAVKKAGLIPGDANKALEHLKKRANYGPPKGQLSEDDKVDTSEANASSIGFIFEYDNTRLLLVGDAFANVLEQNLATLGADAEPIDVAAFKLAHHGSAGNITKRLVSQVAAERYLISTNGKIYDHPDDAAIRRLGQWRTKDSEVVFNYPPRDVTWLDPDTVGFPASVANTIPITPGPADGSGVD